MNIALTLADIRTSLRSTLGSVDPEAAVRSPLPEGRLALLFTDIAGSTALLQQVGDVYGDLLDEHDRVLRGLWDEYGGVEVDNEGDAFFVVFIDHDKAVRAAADVIRRCASHEWPGGGELRIRMSLHSGTPRVRGRHYWGPDVNYAARVCSAAHGGQVLLSASMKEQMSDFSTTSLGEHGLKDFPAPRELFHLVVDGSAPDDFPAPRTLSVFRSNLPTISTPLVGRDGVIEQLASEVVTGRDRLVTLVGPGGIGKTRTVVAFGEARGHDFPDGVSFVSLAAVDNMDAALSAIADGVGAPQAADGQTEAGLHAYLAGRHLLLILDNNEHLPGMASVVATLLTATPRLRILATSQAPLGLREEVVVRLGSLPVPAETTREVAELAGVASVALFVERVRAKDETFRLTEENAAAVADLCRALEGVPLALELAAARTSLTGAAGLVAALERDPEALGRGPADLPERQRGLRATLDWTVSLLSDLEREIFTGLAAFASAWTLELAEQMFVDDADPFEIWDAMSRLVDLSLLVTRGDGRFTMAERVRRHAEELLGASGREHERRRRHAEVMADQLDARRGEVVESFYRPVHNLFELAEETLHAVAWAGRSDPEALRRLVAVSAVTFTQMGRLPAIADHVLALSDDLPGADRIDGLLLVARASVLGRGLAFPQARRRAALDALTCLEEHGTTEDLMLAVSFAVDQLAAEGDATGAGLMIDDLVRARPDIRTQYPLYIEELRIHGATMAGAFEDAERLLDTLEATTPLTHEDTVWISNYRGDCALGLRKWEEAMVSFRRCAVGTPGSHFLQQIWIAHGIATALAGLGRFELAVELVAAVDRVHLSRMGVPYPPYGQTRVPIEHAHAQLAPDALDRAQAAGRQLDYDALRARALELADAVVGPPAEQV
jgi:predicted ATPase/class 3 adenylate cyclase